MWKELDVVTILRVVMGPCESSVTGIVREIGTRKMSRSRPGTRAPDRPRTRLWCPVSTTMTGTVYIITVIQVTMRYNFAPL